MKFPLDYPYSPPSIRFMTKVWHPNVYEVSICKKSRNLCAFVRGMKEKRKKESYEMKMGGKKTTLLVTHCIRVAYRI